MENKNINKEIKKFYDEIMKGNNRAAIMFTDNSSLIYGTGLELIAILTTILKIMRKNGTPESLLEKAFEISKKTDEEIEKGEIEKGASKNVVKNKVKAIREMLDFLEEIDNEW